MSGLVLAAFILGGSSVVERTEFAEEIALLQTLTSHYAKERPGDTADIQSEKKRLVALTGFLARYATRLDREPLPDARTDLYNAISVRDPARSRAASGCAN